jgi:hypothetical protein
MRREPCSLSKRRRAHESCIQYVNGLMVRDAYLQQGVSSNNGQEPFQALAPALNNLVRETVREDFAGKWRNVHSCRLAFENVTESFEIGVTTANQRMTKLESWNIRL